MEDDITASVVAPAEKLKNLNPDYSNPSVKFTHNCEARLFQRPDETVHRGYDKQAEKDLSEPGNFLSNFEPLTREDARNLVEDEPFAVLLSDDIIVNEVPCLKQMLKVYDRCGHTVVAIQRVPRKSVSNYGIIRGRLVQDDECPGRLYQIEDMIEKPSPSEAPSNLAVIGRYILTPSIWKALSSVVPGAGGEIQLTDGLRRLLAKEPVYGYVFEGKRYDAGDKLGFLQATVEIALDRPDLGKAFRSYLRSLHI